MTQQSAIPGAPLTGFPPEIASGTITIADREISYYDSHPHARDRPTTVLLHGTDGSAAGSFAALMPMLSFSRRVVAFDFADPDAAPSLDWYVEQTRQVLDGLGLDGPVSIVGFSFGAVVAARVAADAPERVGQLVLVAGWARTDGQQRLRNELWRKALDVDPRLAAELTVLTSFGGPYLSDGAEGLVSHLVDRTVAGPDRRAKMAVNLTVDIEGRLADIAAPTLIVACDHDITAPPRHSELLFGGIADARLTRVDAGHAVLIERPAEVFTLIEHFLRDPAAHPSGSVIPTRNA